MLKEEAFIKICVSAAIKCLADVLLEGGDCIGLSWLRTDIVEISEQAVLTEELYF